MTNIPNVWSEPLKDRVLNEMRLEAEVQFRVRELPNTLKGWEARRTELRRQIWAHVGNTYDSSLDLQFEVTKTIPMDGYKVMCVHYQSRPGVVVTGNLYVPDGDGPFPAVLNVHGHWRQGRLAERVQARGHSLAKNGYVCLAVDAWGSGERSGVHGEFVYHGNVIGGSLFPIGESLMGAQIVDNMRGVDLLCSLPYVDSERLGVTGASGGGNQTMWVAAMDDRLKAAMPVVSVGTFDSYLMRPNCVCECLPGGLTFTEESGVLALTAPRAMKICNAMQDSSPTFAVSEMLRSYGKAREIWRMYGKETDFTYQAFATTHGYWPEIREAMLGFFDLHLKGIGNGAARTELPFKTLPEEDLYVYGKGTRPENFMSIEAYLRKRTSEMTVREVSLEELGDRQNELFTIFSLTQPVMQESWHAGTVDGWERWTIRSMNGRVLPVLVCRGRKPDGPAAILAGVAGKAALQGSKLLSKALENASQVAIFDPWGTGENGDCRYPSYAHLAQFHDAARTMLWLGRTLPGEWAADFQLVMDFMVDEYEAQQLLLGGMDEMGLPAMLAAAYPCQLATVSVMTEHAPERVAWTDGDDGTAARNAMELCVPKFALWGDIPTLKNLLATAGVTLETL